MKYLIVLCGKNLWNFEYSCVVSVLFGVNIMVGCFICVIILVMVNVLFELVIFSSVWYDRLLLMFFMSW